MSHLTDHELEELLRRAPADIRRDLVRLLTELRELREQAAEREFFETQEIER